MVTRNPDKNRSSLAAGIALAILFFMPSAAAAQTSTSVAASTAKDDWVTRWFKRVNQARASQPHHVAPLITTHVALIQQFRYDSYQQTSSSGAGSFNFGAGKGLEIIPVSRVEVQVAVPPYMLHQAPHAPDGFGDVSMFFKFRAFSAPEGHGDYFIGAFLGASFPSGTPPNGMGHTVWSPMLAASKGWGKFDVQSTLSGNLPACGVDVLGRQIVFNNTFQYNVVKKVWPEVEINSTFLKDGPNSGKKQSFLTPGLIVGSFPIAQHLRFTFGGGVQIATTQFHPYNHRWIWTLRFPFY